jgi:hypothetical protein
MTAARLTTLEQNHARTDARLVAIEGAISRQGVQLEHLVELLSRHAAEPKFDPFVVLKFITTATVLAGLLASAIIYVSTNTQSERFAVLETRLQFLMHADQVIRKSGAQ